MAVLLFNGFVAPAGAFAQTLNINYFNFAALVPNNTYIATLVERQARFVMLGQGTSVAGLLAFSDRLG
jgi:hypothetical protein